MSKELTVVCVLGWFFLVGQVYSSHFNCEAETGDKRCFKTLNDSFCGDEESEEPQCKKACIVMPSLSLDEGWKAVEALPFSKSGLASGGPKDRYPDVTPFEFNRFKYLADDERYINASLVKFDNCQQTFIQSQAPLISTIADHWEMIWQSDAATTVMLTNFFDRRTAKAQCYWPIEEGKSEEFGDNFNVKLLKREEILQAELLNVVQFDFQIEKGSETKKHTLIHYKLWLDQGVVSVPQILELYTLVKNIHPDKKQPIIVHCSAGIGRAGTFVALYSLLSAFEEGIIGDPSQQVLALRKQRARSVQTKGQYALVYESFNQFVSTHAKKRQ
jgi:protein tyrosine phosphatase